MKTAKPLRDLAPGAAWNKALRRSLAICIAGFFLPSLLAELGAIPQLHQSFHFLPGDAQFPALVDLRFCRLALG